MSRYLKSWRCVRGYVLGIFFLSSRGLAIRYTLAITVDDMFGIDINAIMRKIQKVTF